MLFNGLSTLKVLRDFKFRPKENSSKILEENVKKDILPRDHNDEIDCVPPIPQV